MHAKTLTPHFTPAAIPIPRLSRGTRIDLTFDSTVITVITDQSDEATFFFRPDV